MPVSLLSVDVATRARLQAIPFPADKPLTDASFLGYVVPSPKDLQQGSPDRQEWRRLRSPSGSRSVAVLLLRQPMGRIRGKQEENWQSRMRQRGLKLMAGTASVAKRERFLVPGLTVRALLTLAPLPTPPPPQPPPPPPQQQQQQQPPPPLLPPPPPPPDQTSPLELEQQHHRHAAPFCVVGEFGPDTIFPAEAAGQLVQGFQRVWAAAECHEMDAMAHVGLLRGKSLKAMTAAHGTMARHRLGWQEPATLPCGGLHGGYSAMAGASATQSFRFEDSDGNERQGPFLWKLDEALSTHDPEMHSFAAALQYALEHVLLRADPERWLRQYELFRDLDVEAPAPGRLYRDGMYNQYVLNRNLLLDEHTDHLNHEEVQPASAP